jgi:hypothetical protein
MLVSQMVRKLVKHLVTSLETRKWEQKMGLQKEHKMVDK